MAGLISLILDKVIIFSLKMVLMLTELGTEKNLNLLIFFSVFR